MVKKLIKARIAERKKKANQVKLKAHHTKPFRKRHLGSLVLLIIAFVLLAGTAIQYRDDLIRGATSSRDYLVQLVTNNDSGAGIVSSKYGFSFEYDTSGFYVTAVDGQSGKVYQGGAIEEGLPYTAIQVSPFATTKVTDRSAFNMYYHPEINNKLTNQEAYALALDDAGIKHDSVALISTGTEQVGGRMVSRSVWQTASAADGPFAALKVSFSVYTTDLNGHPFSIVIAEGFVNKPGTHTNYQPILDSLMFDTKISSVSRTVGQLASTYKIPTLLDTISRASIVSAATNTPNIDDSARISALYGPSVVKIYNYQCQDVYINGIEVFEWMYDYGGTPCSGSTGSGFIVSQDGYVATNGHVAATDVRNFTAALILGEITAGYSESFVAVVYAMGIQDMSTEGMTTQEILDVVYDELYQLDDDEIVARNTGINLLVSTDEKVPSAEKLAEATIDRTEYKTEGGLKRATVKAFDFRYSFIKSTNYKDVAILKMDGNNFPISHLGTISEVSQGDTVHVMGFPGNASDNSVVDDKTSLATLTSGKATAIKNTGDGGGKVIETDATISHGNSGGPAYSGAGNVIGMTTYSVGAKQSGDANFGYLRDIKDLKDLAAKSSIVFDTDSTTQANWEKAMEYFYTAHYSKALPLFEKVKADYPTHNKVEEFTATAQTRIDQGLDVKDFPIVPVVIVSAVLLLAIGVVVVVIVRQNKKHKVYQAGVAQGVVAPMSRGDVPQTVVVNPQVQQLNGNVVQDQVVNSPVAPPPAVYTEPSPTMPPTSATTGVGSVQEPAATGGAPAPVSDDNPLMK